MRVLIAEDDATTRRVLSLQIVQLYPNAVLVEASSGEAALEALRRGPFDILLADFQMSWLDGVGLLKIARRDHPCVCRVLLTGQAHFDVALNAINRAGVHAFLVKPVSASALADALPKAMERARTESA